MKPIWKSKTFWVNAITVAVGVLIVIAGNDTVKQHPSLPGWIMTAQGCLNVLLRVLTSDAVAIRNG